MIQVLLKTFASGVLDSGRIVELCFNDMLLRHASERECETKTAFTVLRPELANACENSPFFEHSLGLQEKKKEKWTTHIFPRGSVINSSLNTIRAIASKSTTVAMPSGGYVSTAKLIITAIADDYRPRSGASDGRESRKD